MSVFGFNEAAALAAWTAFVIYDPSNGAARMWKQDPKSIQARKKSVLGQTAILLYFLFSLLSAAALVQSIFYFAQTSVADSALFIAGVVLYIVHILVDKAWRVAVHNKIHNRVVALIMMFFMIGTAAGLWVVVGISWGNTHGFAPPLDSQYGPSTFLCVPYTHTGSRRGAAAAAAVQGSASARSNCSPRSFEICA
jgi:hypothetical protein